MAAECAPAWHPRFNINATRREPVGRVQSVRRASERRSAATVSRRTADCGSRSVGRSVYDGGKSQTTSACVELPGGESWCNGCESVLASHRTARPVDDFHLSTRLSLPLPPTTPPPSPHTLDIPPIGPPSGWRVEIREAGRARRCISL